MQIGIIRGEANTDILAAPDLDIHKWIGVVNSFLPLNFILSHIFFHPNFLYTQL